VRLEIREATIEDSQNIYDWRIDPINSKYSWNGSDLPFEVHEERLKKHLSDDECLILIVQLNDSPCCVVRFDGVPNDKFVSIYMVPGYHRKKLSLLCLLMAESYLSSNIDEDINLYAEIMEENEASKILFSKAGYDHGMCDWRKVI